MKELIPGTILSALIWIAVGVLITLTVKDDGTKECQLTHTVDVCYNALNR